MAYICNKPNGSCKTCGHYRYDEDENRMSCFAQYDEEYGIKEPDVNIRTVVALIEVNDTVAMETDMGTIDYLNKVMAPLATAGITLQEAKILDEDDLEDADSITYVNAIFKED